MLQRAVDSDENIKSIGVKRTGIDRYLMSFGPHQETWDTEQVNDAGKQIGVVISANGKPWGDLQIGFEPYSKTGSLLGFAFPYGLLLFVFGASSLIAWMILARSLRYLNPSNVVPDRVRSALDTLAEGLVLLDGNGEIAHANESFRNIAASETELLGKELNSFGWHKEVIDGDESLSLIHI